MSTTLLPPPPPPPPPASLPITIFPSFAPVKTQRPRGPWNVSTRWKLNQTASVRTPFFPPSLSLLLSLFSFFFGLCLVSLSNLPGFINSTTRKHNWIWSETEVTVRDFFSFLGLLMLWIIVCSSTSDCRRRFLFLFCTLPSILSAPHKHRPCWHTCTHSDIIILLFCGSLL